MRFNLKNKTLTLSQVEYAALTGPDCENKHHTQWKVRRKAKQLSALWGATIELLMPPKVYRPAGASLGFVTHNVELKAGILGADADARPSTTRVADAIIRSTGGSMTEAEQQQQKIDDHLVFINKCTIALLNLQAVEWRNSEDKWEIFKGSRIEALDLASRHGSDKVRIARERQTVWVCDRCTYAHKPDSLESEGRHKSLGCSGHFELFEVTDSPRKVP